MIFTAAWTPGAMTPREQAARVRGWRTRSTSILVLALSMWAVTASAAGPLAAPPVGGALDTAQALFYNGQYAEAAEVSQALSTDDQRLAVYELRTSAILFQIRRAIGEPTDKDKAFKACAACPALMESFTQELSAGQSAAREVLKAQPQDATALFFLGKLDLNYVWLVLGTLGRKTGWNEYWEARHSLDAALVLRPEYLRARVARAWIDYIVDTRMPWGTGWLLGGGNKKRALAVMREAADSQDEFYARAEALFGLWDMQVREKNFKAALQSAQRLSVMFPANPEVARFIALRSKQAGPVLH
jgi:tetratricopeptide (TPR) repeat protein